MPVRVRRLVAMVGIVAFLAFYIWAVLAIHALLPRSVWTDLIYYPIVGLAWGVPLFPLLRWAEREPPPR
jgi:hypothetical protein